MSLKKRASSKSDGKKGTMSALHKWRSLLYVNDDKAFPVILGKGGQLSATIAFAGHDIRTSPDEELMRAARDHINVLAEYADSEAFVFHDDLTSAPSEYARAPWFRGRDNEVRRVENEDAAPMVKLLSRKRERRHSRLVEPVIFKTITFQPNKNDLGLINEWMNGKTTILGSINKWFDGTSAKEEAERVNRLIAEFNEHVENIRQRLSESLGHAMRLNADQLYSYCYYTLTGLWKEMKAPPCSGASFEKLFRLKRYDDGLGNHFGVGGIDGGKLVHVRVVTMYGMPEQIRPEFFEALAFLGPGIRWTTRVSLLPTESVRAVYLAQFKRFWDSTQTWIQRWREASDGTSNHDPMKLDLAHKAKDDFRETRVSRFGAKLISTITIYRETAEQAEVEARNVERFLSSIGKPCEIEDFASKLAMAITLPGNVSYEFTEDTLPDYPTVMSLPCSLPYTGPDMRGGIGELKQSVAWQFTIKDLLPARVDFGNGQNRHVCITAPVRTGKSTLLQVIITFLIAYTINPFVFMLDMDMEKSASNISARANGGIVISFKDGTAAIQPFRNVHRSDRRETAIMWVKQCVKAHDLPCESPEMNRNINEAMDLMATIGEEHRTVEQFRRIVQDQTVRDCLEPFATGAFSTHVGGNRNAIGEPPYVVVDCTGLAKRDPKAACVVSALIDEITFNVATHDGPVQLCIDEGAQVLPLIPGSLDGAYKRWPKQGGGITIVLHDPKDLDAIGKTGEIIIQNTGAWVCLGDKGATANSAYDTNLRLTDFQRALLTEIETPGEFMLKIGDSVRVIQTDLSRLEKWVLGQTGKFAEKLCNELDLSQDRDEFCVQLLRKGGFYDEAKWIENCGGGGLAYLRIAAE